MDNQVVIFDHPLISHKISILRDVNTGSKQFRELVEEIAMLMGYEALRDLPTEYVEVKTPITTTKSKMIAGKKVAIVPILRAGLGMVEGILALIPTAKVGHIGLYRDEETLEPQEYYCKLPNDIANSIVIILDPMLATGGSAVAAVDFLKARGCKNIILGHLSKENNFPELAEQTVRLALDEAGCVPGRDANLSIARRDGFSGLFSVKEA